MNAGVQRLGATGDLASVVAARVATLAAATRKSARQAETAAM